MAVPSSGDRPNRRIRKRTGGLNRRPAIAIVCGVVLLGGIGFAILDDGDRSRADGDGHSGPAKLPKQAPAGRLLTATEERRVTAAAERFAPAYMRFSRGVATTADRAAIRNGASTRLAADVLDDEPRPWGTDPTTSSARIARVKLPARQRVIAGAGIIAVAHVDDDGLETTFDMVIDATSGKVIDLPGREVVS